MKTIVSDEPLTEAEMREMVASTDQQEPTEPCQSTGANASPVAAERPSEDTPPKPSTATTSRPSAKRREERLRLQQSKPRASSPSLSVKEPPAQPDYSGLRAELGAPDSERITIICCNEGPLRGMWINKMPKNEARLTTVWEMIAGRMRTLNREASEKGLPPVNLVTADEETWAKAIALVIVGFAERIDL